MTNKSLTVNIVIFNKLTAVLSSFLVTLVLLIFLTPAAHAESSWKTAAEITKNNTITVYWQDVDADVYRVFRATSETGNYREIGVTEELKFTDKKVSSSRTYYYIVKAYEVDGIKAYLFDTSRICSKSLNSKQSVSTKSQTIDNYWAYFLINVDSPLPSSYKVDLEVVEGKFSLDKRCAKYARKMLADGAANGLSLQVVSAYRTVEKQKSIMANQINYYLNKGYDREYSKTLASREVQVPGSSEHNAGLAMDVVTKNWYTNHDDLTQDFAYTKEYKWLSKNAHKYGFILRYPENKEYITGISYEPWHYRFVGMEMAKRIYESGLSMEEFVTLTKIEDKLEATIGKNNNSNNKTLSHTALSPNTIFPSIQTAAAVPTDSLVAAEEKFSLLTQEKSLSLSETDNNKFFSFSDLIQIEDNISVGFKLDNTSPPHPKNFIDESKNFYKLITHDKEKPLNISESFAVPKKSLGLSPHEHFLNTLNTKRLPEVVLRN